jgi:hypothetical protein
MKNILTIFIFFIVGNINAQIIPIPNANFKAKLLQADVNNTIALANDLAASIKIDINNNGEIEQSEALLVYSLNVSNSNISSLQGLSYFTNLVELYCNNNQLATLDVSSNINLLFINCKNNFLTTIDTSLINDLAFGINCENNLLTSLNLKGIGSTFNYAFNALSYGYNPNLEYICINSYVDISNPFSLYGYIQDYNSAASLSNCVVNSYCSFAPGGTYYTIQGNTKYDQANNGCEVSDTNYANLKINLTDGTNSGTIIANGSGNYSLPVAAGTHTMNPVLENPSYFTISPSTTNVTFPTTASPFSQNFCISPNGVHNDLSIELIPLNNARPGFDSLYKIKYKNKGTQTQSGTVNFTLQDAVQDVVATNPSPTTSVLNTLSWSFTNLLPFETREISILLNVNSSVETPAVNSGDVLSFSSTIVGLTDETPTDNSVEVNQIVVNSFDPNDKTCLEGTTINPTKIGDYVHYMIRFENSGTANAQNVVVKDMIDATKFEISTLQFVDSSHPCITKISNGNRVEFIFEGINLPFNDANNDGYIVFKIKSKNTLVVGDQITNNANIYFDYNAPIATNITTSTYQALNNIDFSFGNYFTLSPVPAKDFLNIASKQQVVIKSISVYNMLGQLVQTFINPSNTIDVSNLKSGSYILKMTTENGVLSSKFLKE